MKKLWVFVVALLWVCGFAVYPAYAQLGSGTVTGIVNDDQGNPLPGVSVSAKNTETGFERTDVSSGTGSYRIPSVPFGIYDITAQLQNFATQVKTDVRVDVGRTLTIDFQMRLSTTAEVVQVTGETPLIENTESHIATTVTPDEVENLPLNGRQFANLGALAPGTTLSVHPDPTRPSNLAISLIGGSGRNMNVTVDGGDNNDDTVGGINQFYSLESVAEFTLFTNRYKAEYGRSSGGVLNVVTKSGTNTVHGSGFSLFRDQSLNALTESERQSGLTEPSAYSREQFGGSIGGPIVRDRAHFFFAAERSQADQEVIVNTRGIAPELDGAEPLPTKDTLLTAKVTANLDPRQFLTVRYGQQKTETLYGASPTYAPNAWGTLANDFHSILASHSFVVSDDKLNEFTFQYADFANSITPNSNDPTESFPNGVYLGQNFNVPQTTSQHKYQFKDDFSWSMGGNHHFKAGINFVHEPLLGGSFSTGTIAPQFIHLGNDRNSPVAEIVQFVGEFLNDSPNNQTGVYFQDDWNVNEHLTLNLGLRYDIVTGLSIDQSPNPFYLALHNSSLDFTYLQPFQDSANGSFELDKNNFQPRVGAAYDWKGDGSTVIRGGWGLYYDFPYTNANLLFALGALNGYGVGYNVADPNGIRNADGSFFEVGDPLPPNQIGAPVPRDAMSPDWKIPYTNQASVGFSQQIGNDSAVDVDYVHVAVRDQYLRSRVNGTLSAGGPRAFPGFASTARIYFPGGFSDYDGVSFSYRTRVHKGVQVQAAYTLSKAEGNTLFGSDEFRLGSPPTCTHCPIDFKIGPEDDPQMVGPLNTDARHRLVLAGIFDLPYDFVVSGFFRATSSKPFNAFDPSSDPNGDAYLYDTPDSHVNSRRGDPFSQLDIRVSKAFRFGDTFRVEGIFEVFNLFNSKNPGSNNQSGNAFNGDLSDPLFGSALLFAGDPGQGEQRLAQIGFRVEF